MSLVEAQSSNNVSSPDPQAIAGVCCRMAREDFERIVETRPGIDQEAITRAVGKIIRLRDALISERRRVPEFPAAREELLQQVNAILSLTVSAEFPLVGVRWERIVAVRDALRELAADEMTCRVEKV